MGALSSTSCVSAGGSEENAAVGTEPAGQSAWMCPDHPQCRAILKLQYLNLAEFGAYSTPVRNFFQIVPSCRPKTNQIYNTMLLSSAHYLNLFKRSGVRVHWAAVPERAVWLCGCVALLEHAAS